MLNTECNWGPSLQVFFYFSGHGGNKGSDTIMYGDDGTAVSFYQLFHTQVASKGCPVIAVLDCCRDNAATPQDVLVSVCSCAYFRLLSFLQYMVVLLGFPLSLPFRV